MMGQGRKKETAGNVFLSSRFFLASHFLLSFFLSFFLLHSAGCFAAAAASGLAGFVISFSGMSLFALSCLLFIFL